MNPILPGYSVSDCDQSLPIVATEELREAVLAAKDVGIIALPPEHVVVGEAGEPYIVDEPTGFDEPINPDFDYTKIPTVPDEQVIGVVDPGAKSPTREVFRVSARQEGKTYRTEQLRSAAEQTLAPNGATPPGDDQQMSTVVDKPPEPPCPPLVEKHSPEPWTLDADNLGIYDSNGHYVIDLQLGRRVSDYERIVACVNYCQHTPTAELIGATWHPICKDAERIDACLAYCDGIPTEFLESHAALRRSKEAK